MSQFDQLDMTVRETIKSGRIGQPVFVRLTVTVEPAGADTWAVLAALVPAVQAWFGVPIQRLYAVESSQRRHSALALQFQGGPSALLSSASPAPAGTGLDVLILGNRGGLYHDGLMCGAPLGIGLTAPQERADDPIRKVIETSLRTGRPQALPPEGKP